MDLTLSKDIGFYCQNSLGMKELKAKFPHNPILHYACRSLLWKIMAKTMQQLWDYALFLLFLGGETKDYIH